VHNCPVLGRTKRKTKEKFEGGYRRGGGQGGGKSGKPSEKGELYKEGTPERGVRIGLHEQLHSLSSREGGKSERAGNGDMEVS